MPTKNTMREGLQNEKKKQIINEDSQINKVMKKALVRTDFNFPGQKSVYHGKVRDVYNINDDFVGNGGNRPYLCF